MYNVFVYNLLVRNNIQTDSAGDFLLLRSTHKKGCEMRSFIGGISIQLVQLGLFTV